MKKYFSNLTLISLLAVLLIYFAFRMPNLTLQPIFADEAIYIRWAQVAKAEPTLRFISLQDGKTPLFMWLMAPFLMIFNDPLLAGRLLSVLSGFFTLLGAYFIGSRFFSNRVGVLGAFLIATTPFMVFFDRMALVDSMLSAFTVWSIYFGLKLALTMKFKYSIFYGVMVGFAMLTKTPGMINLALSPLFLMFFDFSSKNRNVRFVKFTSYFTISGAIAISLYLIQRLDPNFHLLSSRNSDYIHPLSRFLEYPFDPFIPHLKNTAEYFFYYFNFPLILLIPFAILLPIIKKKKEAILIFLWALIPFCYEQQFIKAYTARYILFCIPLLLILISYAVDIIFDQVEKRTSHFINNVVLGIFALLLFIWPLFFASRLLSDPASVPLPRDERRGYLEDWTAGYGFKEIAIYLDKLSKKEKIIVGTEGFFGTLPDGLQIYLDKNRQVIIRGEKAIVSEDLKKTSIDYTTFFVANKSRYPIAQPGLKLINEYPKAVGSEMPPDSILFFEVLPLHEELDSARLKGE